MTHKEVLEKAKEYRVKFIRLQLSDIFGTLKNLAITVEDLEQALAGEISFDSSIVDGAEKNWEKDIILRPDPATFTVFPWRPREGAVARLICDVINPDGTPFPGCPRSVLKQVLKESAQMGLDMRTGSEIEFYLFHTDGKGNPLTDTHDHAGYCDLTPVDQGENARRDMVLTLEEMGFEIGASHHEAGPGQQEIVLKHENALEAADKVVTFKFVVRTIAQRHGLHASFMPKPLNGLPGSALHFHLSLCRQGANLFFDPLMPWELGQEAKHFLGGILTHARANSAITNPVINSYKRLIPGELVPTCIAWSERHRNAMLRVPAQRGQATWVEARNPDPACNPYLALAVIIKAGLTGIQEKIQLPPPMSDCKTTASLPRNLEEALQELSEDRVIKSTLGDKIYKRFTEEKAKEYERFHAWVHPWEQNEYLA